MKAITLHQPWASLIACGLKTIETRNWPPPRALIGQRIAIHAAKARAGAGQLHPATHRAILDLYGIGWGDRIPLGVVVATARLADVRKVTQNPRLRGWEPDHRYVLTTDHFSTPEHREVEIDPWGDFSLGRWLWMLTDVQQIEPPMPARGRQRLWEWNPDGGKAL